jgi:hypothetical protein
MPNVSGVGTTWNLPNFWGELFTASLEQTPFLTMIGGTSGGGKITGNFEFATSVEYEHEEASQPEISEQDSITAPTAIEYTRNQVTNVAQPFHESVILTYEKLSNYTRLSGLNTANKENNVQDALNWQISLQLKKIARDIEKTNFIGVYQKATDKDTPNKTRGMLAACELNGGTAINASGAALSKKMLEDLFKAMEANGAIFITPVIWVSGEQKTRISNIFGYAPDDRNIGGVNIKVLETDYGNIAISSPHRFMPNDTLLLADMSVISPVTQPVPGKGNFFYEDLAKNGAAERGQIWGKYGLDHGPAFMHGKITNLATS